MTNEPVLMLTRGDVESLVLAAMLHAEHRTVSFRFLPTTDPVNDARLACARAQARLFEGSFDVAKSTTEKTTNAERLLCELHDGLVALPDEHALESPARCGPCVDSIERALEIADRLAEANALARERARPAIGMRLLDLDCEQTLALAYDLAVPFALAWPCETLATQPCGDCAGCVAYRKAERGP